MREITEYRVSGCGPDKSVRGAIGWPAQANALLVERNRADMSAPCVACGAMSLIEAVTFFGDLTTNQIV